MIRVNVSFEDKASPAIKAIISALEGSDRQELNEQGGRAAANAAAKYHRAFDQGGGWRGKRYLGPGPNDGSSFGSSVARGWSMDSVDANGAVIANDAEYYGFKVTGGTIRPKRAKALTIPLIQEAKGIRASVYSQNTGRRLFTIRGKNALFERLGVTVTGSRGRRGQAGATSINQSKIRPVYALMKSLTLRPWPGALPPDDLLSDAFTDQWIEGIADIIERS